MMTFAEKLKTKQLEGKYLCLGIDDIPPVIGNFETKGEWATAVVKRVVKIVLEVYENLAACKFSFAGWLRHLGMLQDIVENIHLNQPSLILILDAKWNDVLHTMEKLARYTFDEMRFDACTLSPYPGTETHAPFYTRKDRGAFVLCKTSNPGSAQFQNCELSQIGIPLWRHVSGEIERDQNAHDGVGMVFGATHPDEIVQLRGTGNRSQLLLPGIGKQGGDLESTLKYALLEDGTGALVNVSRSMWENLPDDDDNAADEMFGRVRDFNQRCRQIIDLQNRGVK